MAESSIQHHLSRWSVPEERTRPASVARFPATVGHGHRATANLDDKETAMASADGTWNCSMSSPMGTQQMTLTLATSGNELSGKLDGPQGSMEFTGGTVDGDNLTWTVSIEQPMKMDIETSATVDGDTIKGESKLGSFGTAQITGTRA